MSPWGSDCIFIPERSTPVGTGVIANREPRVQSLRIPQVSLPCFWSVARHWHSCQRPDAPDTRIQISSDAPSVASTARWRQTNGSRHPSRPGGFLEKRKDRFLEVPQRLDRRGRHAALRALRANSPAAEERDQGIENLPMVLVLVDTEGGLKLPPPCRRIIERRCTDTEKQPSPSTKPTTQSGLSTLQGLAVSC